MKKTTDKSNDTENKLTELQLTELVTMYTDMRVRLLKEGKSRYDQGVVDALASVITDLEALN